MAKNPAIDAARRAAAEARAAAAQARAQGAQFQALVARAQAAITILTGQSQVHAAHARMETAQAKATHAQPLEAARLQKVQSQAAVAQLRLQQLQDRRDHQPGFADRLITFIRSTRISAGGASPLVGRGLDLLGLGSGKLGLLATGLLALGEAARRAAAQMMEVSQAALESGGTVGQVAFLSRIGIPTGEIGGRAAQFHNRLATDPFAQQAGIRLGIGPVAPRPFGPTNEAALLLRGIEGLRKIEDVQERIRVARMAGLESELALAQTSAGIWEGLKRSAAVQNHIQNDAASQDSADFMGGLAHLGGGLMNLLDAVAKPVIAILGPALDGLGYIFDALAVVVNAVLTPITAFIDALKDLANWLDQHGFGGKGAERGDAMDAHTKAMLEHSRALRAGTFGGAERLRGSLPQHLKGQMLREAIEGQTVALGGFAA